MSKREKRPLPIVRKTTRGISPVDAFGSELLFADPVGTEYDLVKRSRRSNRQLGLYWKALSLVVQGTNKWATAEHLHDALKRASGYVTVNHDMAGNPFVTTDSTAFDAMNADEFRAYFDAAMEKLSAAVGFDPLAFMQEAA